MMNLTKTSLMSILFAAGALAGCSGVKLDPDVPVESRTPGGTAGTGGATTGSGGQSQVTPVDLGANGGADTNLPRIIYFDFDSFAVKDEYRPLIDSYAKALTANRQRHLAVEGHTDERGGSEYNLALGQKRAEAVAKSLTLLGAGDAQVEAVSFGKERPAVQGHDEAAWAKNRRAELAYR